jgi:wobble nucleotide-excising tRNase
MIKQIRSVKKFGKFDNLTQTGQPFIYGEDNCNILYGFNGSGKTTVSNVMSLFSPLSFVDQETKNSLYSDLVVKADEASIELVNDSGNPLRYGTSRNEKRILVFNENFVSAHVYDGSNPTLKKFTNTSGELGNTETIKYSGEVQRHGERLEEINVALEKLDQSLKILTAANSKRFGNSLTDLNKKISAPKIEKDTIDNQRDSAVISEKIVELSNDYNLSKRQDGLTDDLNTLHEPLLSMLNVDVRKVEELINQQVVKQPSKWLDANIELLKQSFDDQSSQESIERWFRFAKQLLAKTESHDTHECPTCNQGIEDIKSLLEEYELYFNNDYELHVEQIETLIEQLEQKKSVITSNSTTINTATPLFTRYAYLMSETTELPIIDEGRTTSHIQLLIDRLNGKKGGTVWSAEDSEDKVTYDEVNASLIEYDNDIQAFRKIILALAENLKKKSLSPHDIEKQLRKQYRELTLAEFDGDKGRIQKYLDLKAEQEILNNKLIPEAKTNLANAVKNLKIESKAVEKYLRRLGIDHFTVDLSEESEGGVKIIFSNTGVSKDGFRNSLSTGEKTALAFAYFISKVENELSDDDFKKSCFVIDDPISSLDEDRVYMTAYLVHDVFKDCRQLIVLSHNFLFLKNFNAFYLGKNHCYFLNGETIADLPVEMNNFESPYFYMLQALHQFKENALSYETCRKYMPNYVRRVLETFFNFKFCMVSRNSYSVGLRDFITDEIKKFNLPQTTVGNITQESVRERLYQINRLCDGFSHGSLLNTLESYYISEQDLRELVTDTLDVITYFDTNHTFRSASVST